MTTERLYYDDSYLRSFTARVVDRTTLDGRAAVALDRSAFYPEGGGQPADQGSLSGVPVVDVQVHDGVVWHILARAEALPDEVQGEIDWVRRFDHMQQHLGQHLLTAAFIATSGFPTVSFHLGSAVATIDLDAANLRAEQVQAAEELANAVVWEDRPVTARFVPADELATLPLRKPPTVAGPVRVVSVPAFDYSACGGTHPRSSGSVGMIAVRGWTRQKGGVRVEFVCGGRALREYRRVNGVAARTASALSVGIDELDAAVDRLRAAHDLARKEAEQLHEQVLDATAQELLAAAPAHGATRLVCRVLNESRVERLRALAQRIAAQPGGVAVLGAASDRASLVVACAADSGLDARVLLLAGLAAVQGRGGGSAALAQGGGPHVAGLPAALEAMRALVIPSPEKSALG